MRSMAEDEVVLGELDVLFPLSAEAVGVKLVRVCKALQPPSNLLVVGFPSVHSPCRMLHQVHVDSTIWRTSILLLTAS